MKEEKWKKAREKIMNKERKGTKERKRKKSKNKK
jgi:hypothetical protein